MDTAERCVPVATQEGQQILLRGNTCACSKLEEDCSQRWTVQLKVTNYAIIDLVMELCEIFTSRSEVL